MPLELGSRQLYDNSIGIMRKDYLLRQHGRVSLIGTLHNRKPKDRAGIQELLTLVGKTDHVFWEGTRLGQERFLKSGIETDNYEGILAKRVGSLVRGGANRKREGVKGVRYLEEGFDISNIREKYGFDTSFYLTILGMGIILSTASVPKSEDSFLEAIKYSKMLYIPGRKNLPSINEETAMLKRITESFSSGKGLLNNIKFFNEIRQLRNMRSVLQYYVARIRDFEVIGPNFQKALEECRGSIVVVYGLGHLPLLEAVLRGDEIVPPPAFEEFLATLPPRIQKSYRKLHSIATGSI